LDLWDHPRNKCPQIRAIFATSDEKLLSGLPSRQTAHCRRGERQVIFISSGESTYLDTHLELSMLKFVILSVASLAFVGTAVAADLPKAQPVAPAAPVGKYPVGKWPVGKSPVGKYPVAAPPLVTKS
jgi:hypothetical protein